MDASRAGRREILLVALMNNARELAFWGAPQVKPARSSFNSLVSWNPERRFRAPGRRFRDPGRRFRIRRFRFLACCTFLFTSNCADAGFRRFRKPAQV